MIFLQPKEDHILKYSAPEEFEEIEVIEITEETDAEGKVCVMNSYVYYTDSKHLFSLWNEQQMAFLSYNAHNSLCCVQYFICLRHSPFSAKTHLA